MLSVDPPRHLEIEDGFADHTGTPDPGMPTTVMRVTLSDLEAGGTRMQMQTTFPSVEVMEQLASMGMVEGITLAVGQMDEILGVDVAPG